MVKKIQIEETDLAVLIIPLGLLMLGVPLGVCVALNLPHWALYVGLVITTFIVFSVIEVKE